MDYNAYADVEDVSVYYQIKRCSYLLIKRIFDIICAVIGLILLIPISFIVKIAYMLQGDFHSIFYVQNRIGKDGKEFKFFKFRSMCADADEVLFRTLEIDQVMREEYEKNKKLKNDPRVTKVGKVIRKLSIDEVPQFINVFLGDMSMIGNRPYLPREKKDMGKYYNEIIKTKPGLTGYWQVNGRSDTTFKKRLKLESYYSNHSGLKLDLKIFFKTFAVVLLKKGAE